MRQLRWLLSAPLVVNSFILLYGASFTLTITVWQAFAAAGYDTVRSGVKALGVGAFSSPAAWQQIAAGLYAGGFAALTVLRNEAAAAVAIGVDMGKRVAAVLEGWCGGFDKVSSVSAEEKSIASLDDPDDVPQSPYPAAAADSTSWRRRWASMLLLSVCVGLFVLLACVYVHSTRVASLCVLAAQSLVENLASLVGGDTAKRFGPGSRAHVVLVGAFTVLGMLIQFLMYIAPAGAWYLPNGSAIPAPLRTLVFVPLTLENSLKEVRLACTCDFGRLQGVVVGAKGAGAAAAAAAEMASA